MSKPIGTVWSLVLSSYVAIMNDYVFFTPVTVIRDRDVVSTSFSLCSGRVLEKGIPGSYSCAKVKLICYIL